MSRNTTSEYRSTVSLDGTWHFATDHDDNGIDEGWYDSADSPNEESVTVPHTWQEDGYREYTGVAWYRRTFHHDGNREGRVFVRFGAVDHEASVWVNGTHLGTNRDGYLPFEHEATEAITTGENTLVVRVEDPEDLSEIPHGKQGKPWYTRVSGIWQGVTLERRPSSFVSDVQITPDLANGTVAFEVDTTEESDVVDSHLKIVVSKDGAKIVETTADLVDGTGECVVSLSDPDYWTPETPVLYDVSVSLVENTVIDEYDDCFGMRSIDHDGDHVLLNGDPYYIRGALDQAYYPESLYRPPSTECFEDEIRLAKELGFNLIRKHIKPAHPAFLAAADRFGILVWEEPANPTRYTEASKRAVRDQLQGLIARDYNHPSVVAWSIYNEEWGIGLDQEDYSDHAGRLPNDPEKQAYLRELYEEVKTWDSTRFVCDNSGWAHVKTDLNDYHRYFVSPDRAEPWCDDLNHMVSHPEDNYAVETDTGTPILVSEFGTWGFPDLLELRERYGGDPPWFAHDFLHDPLKSPEGVDERYAATDLPNVFDGYDDLAAAWQAREGTSLMDIIEAMRTRDEIAGYVVTEFADTEWEFNGILDHWREPKEFADDFRTVNDDLLVVADPEIRVVTPGDRLTVDIDVVNDTGEPLVGTLRCGTFGETASQSVAVEGFGTTTAEAGLTATVPDDAETGPTGIEVAFETDERTVTNEVSLVVVRPEGTGDQTVYATRDLATRLEDRGVAVTDELAAADVALVMRFDEEVESFVTGGGRAVVVPGADGRMADNPIFEYRNLPAGESWNLVASLLYQDSDLLCDLCPGARVGWAFDGIFPFDMATGLSASDTVHIGSVEGWLSNWSSPLAVREQGDGVVCSCSFRVAATYGDHPTATLLVNRLIRAL